jgi:hypothetical protein
MERLRSFRYVFSIEFLLVLADIFALCGGAHTLIKRSLLETEVQQLFVGRREKVLALLAQDVALLDGLAQSSEVVAYTLTPGDGTEINVVKKFLELMEQSLCLAASGILINTGKSVSASQTQTVTYDRIRPQDCETFQTITILPTLFFCPKKRFSSPRWI